MKSLLSAIREACSPATWSRGVEIARSGAVVGEADEGDEIVLRVTMRAGVVSPQVVLFPDDDDWTCDCNTREDACAHVAAAAIALKQARDDGHALPGVADGGPAKVGYRLETHDRKLVLRRVIAHPGPDTPDEPIEGSLGQITHAQGRGKFLAVEADLKFEKRFGAVSGGVIAREKMDDVLHALGEVGDLKLDGDPVAIAAPGSGLCVRVWDVGDDFRVMLEQDPAVERIWENGALLRSGKVFALGEHGLALHDFDALRKGRTYRADEAGTIVSELLPRVRRKLPLVIETDRLPETRTMRPRLQIATARDGDGLEVLATIVYGEPAVARVDGDRLTLLIAGATAPVRNLGAEKALARQLQHDLQIEPGVRRKLAPGEAVAFRGRADRADDVAWGGRAHLDFFEAGELSPDLSVYEGGGFDLWFSAGDGAGRSRGEGNAGGRVDPHAVLSAWQRGEDLVPLLGGGFGRVPAEWLSQHGRRVMALLDAKSAAEHPPAWSLPDLAALCEALEQPVPPEFEQLRTLVQDFAGIPEVAPPKGLRATLRDYQRRGVAWLAFLRKAGLGALLADDMGLGKTLQALCAIEGRTLVVAPTSVLPNWAAEVQKFRPALRVDVYHGTGRALDPEADVTLTTYALLRLDADALVDVKWDTVILDEAQAIKNPDSQVARAAFRIGGGFRVAMTGTPVENRLDDLWSQMHFCNPGLLGGRRDFVERWAQPIGGGDEGAAAALRARVGPFVLRRKKSEVAKELPPRTDVVLHCELRPDERAAYDAVRAATQDDIAKRFGAGDSALAVLEALLRLRQAACHPALLPGQGRAAPPPDSSKLELLVERLDLGAAAGHKALVFSQWTSLLDLAEPALARAGLPFVRLDGSTRDRGAVVETFQDPGGPPVMLISLRAGGTGLNLTAADHVYLLDPWWNPAVEDQAADRAHRIGQDKPVLVHRLVARDTVEERILALQERKRALAEAAVQGGAAAGITKGELLELLG